MQNEGNLQRNEKVANARENNMQLTNSTRDYSLKYSEILIGQQR